MINCEWPDDLIITDVDAFGQDDRMAILLLGDSNLARFCEGFPDLVRQACGDDVECRAAGGAWSGSLREQIGDRVLSGYDAIVVSIGSSDNHPDFGSSPTIFRENLSRELQRGVRWIALLPRELLRALAPTRTPEVNAQIRIYAGVLAKLITAAGGIALDVGEITGTLGLAAYEADGIHLTRAAYEKLVPKIVGAIEALSERSPSDPITEQL